MSTEPSRQHVDLPGGRVYYELRGSGPLLLVVGQPMTSGPFGPLADLAEDHSDGGAARSAPTEKSRPAANCSCCTC
jgi:hypothetical protein